MGHAVMQRASCSPSKTAKSSRLPPPRASTRASIPSSCAWVPTRSTAAQIWASTGPCTGMGTTITSAAGQRSAAVRSMSARAELGTLVSRAIRWGTAGKGRLSRGSSRPSSLKSSRTRSNWRSTPLRLGRTSSTWTQRVARLAQKLSLPTTTTPSPSAGTKLSLANWEAHTTPEMDACPSTRVSHRCPFLVWGLLTVASSRKRGAKPRSSKLPMAWVSSLTP